jgi:predicted nucleotidyltransferase
VQRPPELRDVEPLVAAIAARLPDLLGIWLFGSLARGSARPDSDIDLAVLCRAPVDPVRLFDLGLDLGGIASRDVDLVDLRRVPVLLRHAVASEGQRVLATDSPACDEFSAASLALFGALCEERRIARMAAGPRA